MKLEPGDFAGFAEEDLEQMEYNARDGFRLARSTCMHAQQYAEKMIKDRIVQIDSDEPPKTHDLVVLLRILKPYWSMRRNWISISCIFRILSPVQPHRAGLEIDKTCGVRHVHLGKISADRCRQKEFHEGDEQDELSGGLDEDLFLINHDSKKLGA
jgi:hypothetical protein